MKKIAAILLLGIFVFNLFGYRIWLSYLENKANRSLETAMENNKYNPEELISIKQSINLPYYNNTKEFSRMDGEVEVNGVYYKYVKCRIYNDSLELLCLPNAQKTNIANAKDDFFKVTADIQKRATEKNKSNSGNTLKKMLSEFVTDDIKAIYAVHAMTTLPYPNHHTTNLGMLHKTSVEQPPDIAALIS
jgi:chorismate mutase